jgi:hypothetical protein
MRDHRTIRARFYGAILIAAVGALTLHARQAASSSDNCNGPCLAKVSFTDAEGWTSDHTQIGDSDPKACHGHPGKAGTGFDGIHTGPGTVSDHGGWDTENHFCDQIIAAANYSGGAGGRGHRHFRGDGSNNNGGGLKIAWGSSLSNLSACSRIRYPTAFRWVTDRNPLYIKDWNLSLVSPYLIVGYQGGAWGFHVSVGSSNYPANQRRSKGDWVALMGGATGDNQFHEFAWYADVATTTLKMWIDDTLVVHYRDVNFRGLTAFAPNMFTSNQREADIDNDGEGVGDEAGSTDSWTDYDDIVVDTGVTNGGKLEC